MKTRTRLNPTNAQLLQQAQQFVQAAPQNPAAPSPWVAQVAALLQQIGSTPSDGDPRLTQIQQLLQQASQATPAATPVTSAPTSTAQGFTPFTPTTYTYTGTGPADPNQPLGEGFASDYGLEDLLGTDPNFAFGSGSTAPPAAPPAATTTTAPATSAGPAAPAPDLSGVMSQINQQLVAWVAGTGPQPVFFNNLQPAQKQALTQQKNTIATKIGNVANNPALAIQLATSAVPGALNASQGVAGPSPASATGSATTGTADQQGALASLQQVLNSYGLGSMASWAWNEIVAGKSQDQILLDLMQTPQFKDRFPAIGERAAAGLPPISPADYVNYENQATQIMRAAGLPSGFWDSPSDFTHLIASDVSISELQQRVGLATQAAYQVPSDVRAVLARDYGVGSGQLAAFFLDDKTALPLIQRDFTAAQIGGAAYRTGYGSTKTQDETLTDLGVTADQAQQGFSQLVQQRQLFSSLPGENTTGISRDDQLAAMFGGNATDQQVIQQRAAQRAAVFNAGGAYGQSQEGFTLGAAQGA